MAGIVGVVSSSPQTLALRLENLTRPLLFQPRSTAQSWHNDGAAMCRVSPGPGESETQPVFNRGRTKCIVFFGECFDYDGQKRELIQRGHTFAHGDSDAEFCLNLYEEYGESAFARLDGSFCLAILDVTKREAVLVADRMGTRPLFYALTSDGSLVFATQVSAVLSSPDIDSRLDTSAVIEFCSLQRVVGSKTYHRGVQMLAPASALRYHSGQVAITPYWRFDYRPQAGSIDEYAEELARVMRRMAKRLTRGNARVAVLLSGGLDARMVLAAAEETLDCYTFGDYLNPEAMAARAVADARGFPFRFLTRNPDHYAILADRAVELGSGMHAFNHAHAIGFLDAIARDHDVVTHGYVPELLFRGSSLPKLDRRLLGIDLGEKLDPTLNAATLPERMFRRGYSLLDTSATELFSPSIRKVMDETLLVSAKEMIAQAASCSSNVYDQFLWPDVYHHGRYPSMLFEISLRPYMTERSIVFGNEVIDLHLKMPLAVRADNRLWLKAMASLNKKVAQVVNANTGYSPTTPVALISTVNVAKAALGRMPLAWRLGRHDEGHSASARFSPISWPRFDWLIRHNEKLRQLTVDTLSDDRALPPDIFDRDRVQALLNDHLADRGSYRDILFALLTFGRWHKKHGNR